MTIERIRPRFVEIVPEVLEPGILYVSLNHGSMVHLCACGCGNEVALPLTPVDWRLTYDGEDISLSPSVGSWSLPCRSHYIIGGGRVRWAGDWTDKEIEDGRQRDRRRKDERFGKAAKPDVPPAAQQPAPPAVPPQPLQKVSPGGLRGWLVRVFGG